MTAYVALLRAVNVGGTGKLPMTDLAAMCEAAGHRAVKTYIASGNVVLRGHAAALAWSIMIATSSSSLRRRARRGTWSGNAAAAPASSMQGSRRRRDAGDLEVINTTATTDTTSATAATIRPKRMC